MHSQLPQNLVARAGGLLESLPAVGVPATVDIDVDHFGELRRELDNILDENAVEAKD